MPRRPNARITPVLVEPTDKKSSSHLAAFQLAEYFICMAS